MGLLMAWTIHCKASHDAWLIGRAGSVVQRDPREAAILLIHPSSTGRSCRTTCQRCQN